MRRTLAVGFGLLVAALGDPAIAGAQRLDRPWTLIARTPPAAGRTASGLAMTVERPPVAGPTARHPDAASRRFDDLITREAAHQGVRADLVRAIIQVESNFNPRAVSAKGARGLMQLMPATARDLRVSDSFDPEQNIKGGVRYLRTLLDRYDHDESLALAAYNAGPTAVARYGNRVPPFRETKDYVLRVQSVTQPPVGADQRRAIYRLDTGQGSPRYTNVRPATSAYTIVGRR